MPLPDSLGKCISDLTAHCENNQAQIEALRSENQALKSQLEACNHPLPGSVSDYPETSKQARPAPIDDSIGDGIPTEILGEDLKTDARQDQNDEFLNKTRKMGSNKFAGNQSTETLAAARLGMMVAHEDHDKGDAEAVPMLGDVLDSLQVFGDDFSSKGPILARIANSMIFKTLSISAIAANTFYIGHAADHAVKNTWRRIEGLTPEADSNAVDIAFSTWFTLELVIRIAAEHMEFFVGEEKYWNIFDGVLVVSSIAELLAPEVVANLSFLRIFRVFRLVRVVRVVRTVKALKSLRTMVFALLNSFICLVWAFVMILIVMFIFGIIFNNAVASYYDKLDVGNVQALEEAKQVHECFSSLYETMVSLWSAISGGNDWLAYGDLLRLVDTSDMYFLIFCFYIGFCTVGMLNVVTGIFVDSAVCTRTEDEVVECFMDDQKRTLGEVKRIFKEADRDESGSLSCAELTEHLTNPRVKAYFAGLDIDPSDAMIIFALIDKDGTDEVSIDEFVDGTMKLKGNAKSIDVLSMMFDSVRYSIKFNKLCYFIEEQMRDVREQLQPGITAGSSRVFPPTPAAQPKKSKSIKDTATISLGGQQDGSALKTSAVVPVAP
jgi:voltage-gated sodium channel